jgi:3-phenylpropionate/trans-cinnamate dioxygenase ferredoxin reductase component
LVVGAGWIGAEAAASARRRGLDVTVLDPIAVPSSVCLARRSARSNGIAVDERLRTSAPALFAARDVANAQHPFYGERIRVEHWANALNQGPAAARSMLGADAYLLGDRIAAGMNLNVWDVTDPIQRLIRERVPVDDLRLADADVPLPEENA